jgi:hypothetical protein
VGNAIDMLTFIPKGTAIVEKRLPIAELDVTVPSESAMVNHRLRPLLHRLKALPVQLLLLLPHLHLQSKYPPTLVAARRTVRLVASIV